MLHNRVRFRIVSKLASVRSRDKMEERQHEAAELVWINQFTIASCFAERMELEHWISLLLRCRWTDNNSYIVFSIIFSCAFSTSSPDIFKHWKTIFKSQRRTRAQVLWRVTAQNMSLIAWRVYAAYYYYVYSAHFVLCICHEIQLSLLTKSTMVGDCLFTRVSGNESEQKFSGLHSAKRNELLYHRSRVIFCFC